MGVLEIRDCGIKLLAFLHVGSRILNGPLCRTHGTGRDINAPTVQPFHRYGKTLAFFTQAVRDRNTHIIEGDHARRLGIPAHLVFFLSVLNALGIRRYQQRRDPFRPRIRGAGHHHQYVGLARAGDKDFAAIDDIGIAIEHCTGAQAARVGTCTRLSEAVRGELFAHH